MIRLTRLSWSTWSWFIWTTRTSLSPFGSVVICIVFFLLFPLFLFLLLSLLILLLLLIFQHYIFTISPFNIHLLYYKINSKNSSTYLLIRKGTIEAPIRVLIPTWFASQQNGHTLEGKKTALYNPFLVALVQNEKYISLYCFLDFFQTWSLGCYSRSLHLRSSCSDNK